LGFSKGKIDLSTRRSNLLNHLAKVNSGLHSQLRAYENWINEITDYRDFVQHRIMLVSPPVSEIDEKSGTLGPLICRVPSSPLTYGDKESIGLVGATDFCTSLEKHLERVVEIICEDLLRMINSKEYILGNNRHE
jgi:hypothetical protein